MRILAVFLVLLGVSACTTDNESYDLKSPCVSALGVVGDVAAGPCSRRPVNPWRHPKRLSQLAQPGAAL